MTWRDKLELGLKDDAASRRDNLPPDEVHGPEEDSGPGRSPVVTEVRDKRGPAPAPGPHHDTHVTKEQSPVGVGIDAQSPNTMPRAEDDATTRAGDRDVHDQAGSGDDISRRRLFFAPPQ